MDVQFFINHYSEFIHGFSYLGIILVMFVFRLMIPLPEEIILVFIGYISYVNELNIYLILLIAIFGILWNDNILYWIGRLSSKYVEKTTKKFGAKRIEKYENLLRKNIGKSIFLMRFVMGLRSISPILCGSIKIRPLKFNLLDLIAISVFAPIFILLGYTFSSNIDTIVIWVEMFRYVIFFLIVTGLVLYLMRYFKKNQKT